MPPSISLKVLKYHRIRPNFNFIDKSKKCATMLLPYDASCTLLQAQKNGWPLIFGRATASIIGRAYIPLAEADRRPSAKSALKWPIYRRIARRASDGTIPWRRRAGDFMRAAKLATSAIRYIEATLPGECFISAADESSRYAAEAVSDRRSLALRQPCARWQSISCTRLQERRRGPRDGRYSRPAPHVGMPTGRWLSRGIAGRFEPASS